MSNGKIFLMDQPFKVIGKYPFSEKYRWLEDKYGVSWQIVPSILGQMLGDENTEKSERVMKAMLEMKKINMLDLQKAYEFL